MMMRMLFLKMILRLYLQTKIFSKVLILFFIFSLMGCAKRKDLKPLPFMPKDLPSGTGYFKVKKPKNVYKHYKDTRKTDK